MYRARIARIGHIDDASKVVLAGVEGTVSAALDRKARPRGDEIDEATVAGTDPADETEQVRHEENQRAAGGKTPT